MARNADYLRCKQERKNESFFKVVQSINVSSENMRALPHDFVRSFSDKELSRKMKIRAQWGSSWEVGISKNPRFYFMEKSGWEKFVRDNALGNSEFITFTHKGKMHFTVNIFKQDGKEMMQPPKSRSFLASSSRIKTEQEEDDMKEEVVVSSNRGPTTAAESNGRKLNLRKKAAKESQNSKKTEKVVRARRDYDGASSSTAAEFTILFKQGYLIFLRIPNSVAKDHMTDEKTIFKIHHSNGKKSWNVVYLVRFGAFSGGWRRLVKEYPLVVGDTCKFTFIKPDELLLVVSKP
ncbi:B3 DNA binding domain [Arabidopsis thaliana x Arabidopsis arenosa]|uniref:B3 DNA binding domain n=1 Tax=Arabidopsis thaliana x Arabidopsis arenosa TaxID=1240361 RepID=A0A8T2B5S1_9BRAS|nr:B3 DNA binding domain [Arabidopsis thaliana x Arabidopsis arenosa]